MSTFIRSIFPTSPRTAMIAAVMAAVGFGGAAVSNAQPYPAAPAVQVSAEYAPLSMDDLEQLVGPVALYPDAVLADVLAASTYPDEVGAADRWVAAGNDPAGIDGQDWDPSVQSIARFPDILHYMASNGDWMNNLGAAFMNQQSDVMAAVQSLRAQALANGDLQSNAQEQVVQDDDSIEIIPADPTVIYVPVYDPDVIWWHRRHWVAGETYPSLIRWGRGVRVGAWLGFDLDWHDRAIYRGSWGSDRPWWHRGGAGARFDYQAHRPGNFGGGRVGAERNQSVTRWQRDVRRPAPRPTARPAARSPVGRPGTGYPSRAETPARSAGRSGESGAGYDRGSVVSRESQRGRESRQGASPRSEAPATPRPEPRHEAPAASPRTETRHDTPAAAPRTETRHETPAAAPRTETRHETPAAAPRTETRRESPAAAPRTETRHEAPAAAPRGSTPSRGGASGGYQSGEDASRASGRGASSRSEASRGSGGGSGGHDAGGGRGSSTPTPSGSRR